jgi:hypothetical protein
MISNSGAGSRGWGVKTLFMFAILVGMGTIINFFVLPEVSHPSLTAQVRWLISRPKEGHLTNWTSCTRNGFHHGG